jgi:dephospho-CoA kinase
VGDVPFVGLTGGIGAGKSTALAALHRLGAATLSADAVVHELYGSAGVRDAVVARFGGDVAPGGVIDRASLAGRAFATDADRDWLERLIWPLVGSRIGEFRHQAGGEEPKPRAVVVEVPLLFESGADHGFDATIAVVADEALRRRRAARRGHHALQERGERQLSQEEKAAKSTYVVVNDGDILELERKLSSVLELLEG